MEQLNKVIEACEYASDAYWGDPARFKFRAFIDQFTTATELTLGKDRLVKGTFNIRLRGYIIPDTIQKDLTGCPHKSLFHRNLFDFVKIRANISL